MQTINDKTHFALLVVHCLSSVAINQCGGTRYDSIDTQTNQSQSLPSGGQQQEQLSLGPTTQHDAPTATERPLDTRRPIWVVAHMVNSINELEYRLGFGANAVEVDVTFSPDGVPTHTYHGMPCDCWRHCHQQENFNDYVDYVRQVAIDFPEGVGKNLTMLFLDLKLDPLDQKAKRRAGQELANSVLTYLFVADKQRDTSHEREGVDGALPFHLILSINQVKDIDLVENFIHTLKINNSGHLLNENIGFDVGMNGDLQQIESMWFKFATSMNLPKLNLWQGDGITNCLSPFISLKRLSKALSKRENNPPKPVIYPMKVYHWTIDLHDRMRESLQKGVDAVMTNHPERMLTILQEPEFTHDFRLATRVDNPFMRLTRRLVGQSSKSARHRRSVHSAGGGILSQLDDVFDSVWNYMREITSLSYAASLIDSFRSRALSPTVQGRHPVSTPTAVLTEV